MWPAADQAAKVGGAVVIALLALALGSRLRRLSIAMLRRRPSIDPAIALLSGRLVYFSVLVVAALWILNLLGTQITPLLTVLGAAGLAVSLALQDVLRNLFAGVYLLIERPFTIGDLVDVKGISGTVTSVELRLTMLTTMDGLRVTVPNAVVFTEIIVNRSAQPNRRWPVQVVLPPDAGLEGLRDAALGAARQIGVPAPEPTVAVQAATANGVLAQVGFWAPDAAALGQAMLALRRLLPSATVALPGAPDLPKPPPATGRRRRITRTRPARTPGAVDVPPVGGNDDAALW
mgnify:CR=1 FL=1